MPKILAVAGPESASTVAAVAEAVAGVLRATVSRFDPRLPDSQHATAVLGELDQPDAVLGVVMRDTTASGRSWRIAGRSAKPIIVVPPTFAPARSLVISRVLVPLDGTLESASAVRETMQLFANADVELVVLHVFDETSAPRFWDQAAHARRSWEQEFRARFCSHVDVRIELRNGEPGEHVTQVAADEHADLIALGWSQRLEAGRARTVRRTVREADVPIMLVPLSPAGGRSALGDNGLT